MIHNVFVYGSLLSGLQNHFILGKGKSKFISLGKTLNGYYMTARGDYLYPYLTEESASPLQSNSRNIFGEIYQVDDECLHALDELEEYPIYYNRVIIDILLQTTDDSINDQMNTNLNKLNSYNNNHLNMESTIMKCSTYFLCNQQIMSTIKEKYNIDYYDVPDGNWKKCFELNYRKDVPSTLPSSYASFLMTQIDHSTTNNHNK